MARADGLAQALVELEELAERLRRECPWDREQTTRTIVPHTVEEAYEVADAAIGGDNAKLLDELGDVLFACVNVARHLGVDPELELRQASKRFAWRVERAAELAAKEGQEFSGLSLDEQDRWFDLAKERERSAG